MQRHSCVFFSAFVSTSIQRGSRASLGVEVIDVRVEPELGPGRRNWNTNQGAIADTRRVAREIALSVRLVNSCLGLFCEYLAHVAERLEFEGIAGRVQEEHGGLFAYFPLEANMRLNDEFRIGALEVFR
jgi:hypothetical protein